MKKKLWLQMIAALCVIGVLTGCGSNDAGSVGNSGNTGQHTGTQQSQEPWGGSEVQTPTQSTVQESTEPKEQLLQPGEFLRYACIGSNHELLYVQEIPEYIWQQDGERRYVKLQLSPDTSYKLYDYGNSPYYLMRNAISGLMEEKYLGASVYDYCTVIPEKVMSAEDFMACYETIDITLDNVMDYFEYREISYEKELTGSAFEEEQIMGRIDKKVLTVKPLPLSNQIRWQVDFRFEKSYNYSSIEYELPDRITPTRENNGNTIYTSTEEKSWSNYNCRNAQLMDEKETTDYLQLISWYQYQEYIRFDTDFVEAYYNDLTLELENVQGQVVLFNDPVDQWNSFGDGTPYLAVMGEDGAIYRLTHYGVIAGEREFLIDYAQDKQRFLQENGEHTPEQVQFWNEWRAYDFGEESGLRME